MIVYLALLIATVGVVLIWAALLTNKLKAFKLINRIGTALIGISFLFQIEEILQFLINNKPLAEQMVFFWSLQNIGIVLWSINIFYITAIKKRHICLKGTLHHG